VEAPYHVVVRHPSEPSAIVYLGLTLAAPTLVHPGTVPLRDREATVRGTVSATTYPEPARFLSRVAFGSSEVQSTQPVSALSGAYQFSQLRWWGPSVTVGTLDALQWESAHVTGGNPVAYWGHGQRSVTLDADGPALEGQDMALMPVTTANLSGAVTLPAGHTLHERTLATVFAEGSWIVVADESTPAAAFSYLTPVIDGATMAVAALGYRSVAAEYSYAVRAGLAANATGVTVGLPHVPLLTSPVDAATGVGADTPFVWSAPSGGVAAIVFAGSPSAVVVTAGASATLPDLGAVGLSWTPGFSYTWRVYGLPTFATVDAAAAQSDGFLSSWVFAPAYRPVRDGALGVSLQRSFTMAP